MSEYVRINPVEVGSDPNENRAIHRGLPCKFSVRLWGKGDHLCDFNTYFEAVVFATRYSAEHGVSIEDSTEPRQRT